MQPVQEIQDFERSPSRSHSHVSKKLGYSNLSQISDSEKPKSKIEASLLEFFTSRDLL